MAKYILCGKYNYLYKYIWYYLLIQIVYDYFFGTHFPEGIKIKYFNDFPKNILVQEIFNYLGTSLFSFILWKYQRKNNKIIVPIKQQESSNLSLNEPNLILNKDTHIQEEISGSTFLYILSILILSNQLKQIFNVFGLKGLDFWMFELIFICIITSYMFKTQIYRHKIVSICIILIFSTIMKFISIYMTLSKEQEEKIYIEYKWVIIIGLLSFHIIILMRSYAYCKLKWLFDIKYISPIKILIIFGIFGSIICLIGSIISTKIKCSNKNPDVKYFCKVEKDDNKYYDNFIIFFQNIWKKNIVYILFEFFEIFLSFLLNLFIMLIIHNLSPEYLISSKYIFYFITELISYLWNRKYNQIYELLAEFFAILSSLLYLEFIELNFCNINKDLKKNISRRSIEESSFIVDNSNDAEPTNEIEE